MYANTRKIVASTTKVYHFTYLLSFFTLFSISWQRLSLIRIFFSASYAIYSMWHRCVSRALCLTISRLTLLTDLFSSNAARDSWLFLLSLLSRSRSRFSFFFSPPTHFYLSPFSRLQIRIGYQYWAGFRLRFSSLSLALSLDYVNSYE